MSERKRAAVVFVVRAGLVLTVSRTGGYAPPGGNVEPGEEPIDAALRELHEEVGLVCSRSDLAWWFVVDNGPDGDGYIVDFFYAVHAHGWERPREPETATQWATVDQLCDENFCPFAATYREQRPMLDARLQPTGGSFR